MSNAAYKAGYNKIDWSKHVPWEPKPREQAKASKLPCPLVVTDAMAPLQHVDGNYYDSKSAFRAVTKANGYVEVGNDPARLRPPPKPKSDPKARREAVAKATAKVLGA